MGAVAAGDVVRFPTAGLPRRDLVLILALLLVAAAFLVRFPTSAGTAVAAPDRISAAVPAVSPGPSAAPIGRGTWSDRLAAPAGRYLAGLAYDARSGTEILFGGRNDRGTFGDTWSYNPAAHVWTNLTPSISPASRYGASFVYVSSVDRALLFGGIVGTSLYANDTWAFDLTNDTWSNLTQAVSPPTRWGAGAAYDFAADRVLLYGGYGCAPFVGCGVQGDLWSFDPHDHTWTFRNAPGGPFLGAEGPAMAYDSRADRTLLFGGMNANNDYSNVTWSYNYTTNAWTKSLATVHPTAIAFGGFVYDPVGDRAILYGGRTTASFNATWSYAFPADRWTNVTPQDSPLPRSGFPVTYDARLARMVLFGGWLGMLPRGGADELWTYDPATNTWAFAGPRVAPSPRYNTASAFDANAERLVLFGGVWSAGYLSETWAYDVRAQVWTNMDPPSHPSAILAASMVYDSNAHDLILFGGNAVNSLTSSNETWSYDLGTNRWTNLTRGFAPSPRAYASLAYDSVDRWVILFGGYTSSSPYTNDTYRFNTTTDTWTGYLTIAPNYPPPPRYLAAMSYDPVHEQVVLFGGSSSDPTAGNDTWTFNPTISGPASAWVRVSPARSPPQRSGHGLVYDSASGDLVTFGGQEFWPPYTVRSDTWSYNVVTNLWTNLTVSYRPGPAAVVSMGYDPVSNRVVEYSGFSGETWSFDGTTNAWTLVASQPAPLDQYASPTVYDPVADALLFFGSVTWAYHYAANAWTEEAGPSYSAHPSLRLVPAVAYDPLVARTILFGGTLGSGGQGSDTWSYDATTDTWTNVTTSTHPPSIFYPVGTFDAASGRVVVYGFVPASAAPNGFMSVTWTYDAATNAWRNDTSSTGPPVLGWPSLSYDPVDQRDVLFGGFAFPTVTPVNWTWAYNASSNTWTNVTPAVGPAGRYGPSMAFDGRVERLILFGGASAAGYPNDTWTLDVNGFAWKADPVSPNPGGLLFGGLAFDSRVNVSLLFRGNSRPPDGRGSVWAYTAAAVAPSAPRSLAGTRSASGVSLSWQPPQTTGGSAITNYSVARGTSSGAETPLASVGAVLTYADLSAVAGTTYYYTVQAANAIGSGPASAEAVVPPLPLQVTPLATPTSGAAPLNVSFHSAVSGGSPPYTLIWDFGDGYQSTLADPSHVYTSAGTFNVTLGVIDSANRRVNSTLTVTVSPAPPSNPLGSSLGLVAAILVVVVVLVTVLLILLRRRRKPEPTVPPSPPETPPPGS